MESKRVAVLWAGLPGFHGNAGGPADVTKLADGVVAAVDRHRGVLDCLTGDRFMCTFGVVVKCFARQHAAGSAALEVAQLRPDLTPQVGVDAGLCKIGVLGTTMKRVAVVGVVVGSAFACMRMSSLHGARILAGGRFYGEGSSRFVYAAKAVWAVPKFKTDGCYAVYELLEARLELENAEWMYQLARLQNDDPFSSLHDEIEKHAVSAAARGADACGSDRSMVEPTDVAPLNVVL